jgi:hypothetical protein
LIILVVIERFSQLAPRLPACVGLLPRIFTAWRVDRRYSYHGIGRELKILHCQHAIPGRISTRQLLVMEARTYPSRSSAFHKDEICLKVSWSKANATQQQVSGGTLLKFSQLSLFLLCVNGYLQPMTACSGSAYDAKITDEFS